MNQKGLIDRNGKASIEVIPSNDDISLEVMVLNQSFKGTSLTILNDGF